MNNSSGSDLTLLGGLALLLISVSLGVSVALPLLLGPWAVPLCGLGLLATIGWAIARS